MEIREYDSKHFPFLLGIGGRVMDPLDPKSILEVEAEVQLKQISIYGLPTLYALRKTSSMIDGCKRGC